MKITKPFIYIFNFYLFGRECSFQRVEGGNVRRVGTVDSLEGLDLKLNTLNDISFKFVLDAVIWGFTGSLEEFFFPSAVSVETCSVLVRLTSLKSPWTFKEDDPLSVIVTKNHPKLNFYVRSVESSPNCFDKVTYQVKPQFLIGSSFKMS